MTHLGHRRKVFCILFRTNSFLLRCKNSISDTKYLRALCSSDVRLISFCLAIGRSLLHVLRTFNSPHKVITCPTRHASSLRVLHCTLPGSCSDRMYVWEFAEYQTISCWRQSTSNVQRWRAMNASVRKNSIRSIQHTELVVTQ